MGDLLVDPYTISIRAHVTRDEALAFIECPIRWMNTEHATGCRLVISDNYFYALWTEDQYPTPDRLREVHRIACTERFDAETVIRAFDRILDIAPSIESIIGITEVLIDTNKTDVVPATIITRLSPKLQEALVDTLAICALHTALTGIDYPLGFATESALTGFTQNIKGDFPIQDFIKSSPTSVTLPLVVNLKLPILVDAEDVLEILDFDMVCHDAECAIRWSWVHVIARQNRAKNLMSEFKIREEFEQRVVSLGLPRNMVQQVYRKIVYLICGVHSAGLQIEPLRIGRGASSAQICRNTDGANAFRIQISQQRVGYHVHYWRCPDGLIEIAWIGPHNDFYIPE
jgi:hypothetical protein